MKRRIGERHTKWMVTKLITFALRCVCALSVCCNHTNSVGAILSCVHGKRRYKQITLHRHLSSRQWAPISVGKEKQEDEYDQDNEAGQIFNKWTLTFTFRQQQTNQDYLDWPDSPLPKVFASLKFERTQNTHTHIHAQDGMCVTCDDIDSVDVVGRAQKSERDDSENNNSRHPGGCVSFARSTPDGHPRT